MSESQELNSIIGHAHMGAVGYFEVELIHKPTGLIKRKLRFRNVITNALLDWAMGGGGGAFGAFPSYFFEDGWAAIGSGTDSSGTAAYPPAVTDTTLRAEVARTQSRGSPTIDVSGGYDTVGVYWWKKVTKVFLSGVGTNSNLTEVGLFSASSGGTMFCRQLFRDNAGNPTTIAKTADDELRITYEFRIYPQQTSNTTTLTINSVSTTCTTRAYDVDSTSTGRYGGNGTSQNGLINQIGRNWNSSTGTVYNASYSSNSMPALTNEQTGTATGPSAVSWGGYTNGTYYRDQSITFLPGLGNLTIGSITWGAPNTQLGALFITTFDPAFTKTDTQRAIFSGRFFFGRGTGV